MMRLEMPEQPRAPRRHTWVRRIAVTAAVGLSVLFYARFIEPNWVEVTHVELTAPVTNRLTIAHLTDLHTDAVGFRERQVLSRLEEEKPDVIVVTGDMVPGSGAMLAASDFIAALHAPLGVFVVSGNWEHWRPPAPQWKAQLLDNRAACIRPDVCLVGFDDELAGAPDLEAALKTVVPNAARIALFHSPAFYPQISDRVHLALSGHTHGGQVRVPLLPPLWLPPGSGNYVEGLYRHGSSQLYVSRGIGTSVLPLRFACRPELAIISLKPQ